MQFQLDIRNVSLHLRICRKKISKLPNENQRCFPDTAVPSNPVRKLRRFNMLYWQYLQNIRCLDSYTTEQPQPKKKPTQKFHCIQMGSIAIQNISTN